MTLTETTDTDLSSADAEALTARIRQALAVAWDDVAQAYFGRAWIGMGYDSWAEYNDHEFEGRIQLTKEERRRIHAQLSARGMSTRAIAAATGTPRSTVSDDLTGVRNRTPADPDEGMSNRAIGAAVGVDRQTVRNDLRSGGESSPPAEPDDEIATDPIAWECDTCNTFYAFERATLSGLVGGHARASVTVAHQLADSLGCHVETLFPTMRTGTFAEVA